jgi:uroporphyrinogen-III synthase
VDAVVAYRNLAPSEERCEELRGWLARGELDVLTFASPSAVRHLVQVVGDAGRAAIARCVLAAVGPTTARALQSEGFEVDVVPEWPDGRELVAALARHLRRDGESA